MAKMKQERQPRKDRNGLRVKRFSIRVTDYEYDAIMERANSRGETFADYMVARALCRRKRVKKKDMVARYESRPRRSQSED